MEEISWKLIDIYFKDNPSNLVAHHLESYNDFFSSGFNSCNPICLSVKVVPPSKAIMDITEKDIIAAIIPRFVTPKSRL